MTETSPVTFQGFASDSLAVRTGTIGFPANHVEVPSLRHREPSDELLFPRLQLWTPRVVLWRQELRFVFVIFFRNKSVCNQPRQRHNVHFVASSLIGVTRLLNRAVTRQAGLTSFYEG